MAQGDQVYVFRELLNLEGVYEHHGIDCGDGSVIHYRKPSERIERTSLETFARGNLVYIKEYLAGFCFIPDVVLNRAMSRLGEQKYNLLFNNCEHFATWCKTGISDSKQIRDFIPAIAKLNTAQLNESLQQAIQGSDLHNTKKLLDKALGDIRFVWDDLQPKYQESLKEMDIWQKVAWQALQQNREDLARAALKRKYEYEQQAKKLESQLQQLSQMTENLILNSQNLP